MLFIIYLVFFYLSYLVISGSFNLKAILYVANEVSQNYLTELV